MTFHRVVPVAYEQLSARRELNIDGNKAQVCREDQIADVLLVVAEFVFVPLVDFDAVGRLVADLDELPLQLGRKRRNIDEFLPARSRVGPQAGRRWMLLGIRRIEGMK